MNRKVATSDSSETDGKHREAKSVGGHGGSQSDPAGVAVSSDSPPAKKVSGAKASGKSSVRHAPGDVGQLLRGAYRQTVDEVIPDDLMDLLNKLE